jgi:hypothetical protein
MNTGPGRTLRLQPPGSGFSCRLTRFKHEIDRLASGPCTHWKLDLLADLADEGSQVRDGDRGHLDKAATVQGFDLENVPRLDDLTRFFVGAAAQSGSSAQDSTE